MSAGDNTTDSIIWFPGEPKGHKPGGALVDPPQGGSAQFSGCRYSIHDPLQSFTPSAGIDLVTFITNTDPFYDTDNYAPEGFDGDGYFNGTQLIIPKDGYYNVATSLRGNFSGSDSTELAVTITSNRDGDWDVADRMAAGKITGDDTTLFIAVTHWFAEGDNVGLYYGRDGTTGPIITAAIEIIYRGSGTNPVA